MILHAKFDLFATVRDLPNTGSAPGLDLPASINHLSILFMMNLIFFFHHIIL